jgi:hypothetical protein
MALRAELLSELLALPERDRVELIARLMASLEEDLVPRIQQLHLPVGDDGRETDVVALASREDDGAVEATRTRRR